MSVGPTHLLYRRFGEARWSAPTYVAPGASIREVRERARNLVRAGIDGLLLGRLYDWRFIRNSVCIDAWSMTVEPNR